MKLFYIESTRNLPEHDRVLKKTLHYFYQMRRVTGGGPYRIVWDNSHLLKDWQFALAVDKKNSTAWSNVLHEDERYWAWLFYLYIHVNRGEYYNGAVEFPAIRDIFEQWTARLAGETMFSSRKVESATFFTNLTRAGLFPKPDRGRAFSPGTYF